MRKDRSVARGRVPALRARRRPRRAGGRRRRAGPPARRAGRRPGDRRRDTRPRLLPPRRPLTELHACPAMTDRGRCPS
ncbi:MAG: hypothetical protein FJ221_01265 [Lentisphaerae bacterium]|nr:hypothetical protein [Lentisphaerota bacterium]